MTYKLKEAIIKFNKPENCIAMEMEFAFVIILQSDELRLYNRI